jgi:hypothetical protein
MAAVLGEVLNRVNLTVRSLKSKVNEGKLKWGLLCKEKSMIWAGHIARMGRRGFSSGKPEEQRKLGRPSRRWELILTGS